MKYLHWYLILVSCFLEGSFSFYFSSRNIFSHLFKFTSLPPLNIKVALKKEPSSHFFKSAVACQMSNWFWCAYCPDPIMCQVYRDSIKSSKISLEAKIQPVNIETSSGKWPLQTWMKSVIIPSTTMEFLRK